MTYRVIEGVYTTRDKAELSAKKLKGKCKNPQVYEKGLNYMVQLFITDDKQKAEQAISWYLSQKINAGILNE